MWIASAAANSRLGRKILIGALIVLLCAAGVVVTPLVAIPLAIAGQGSAAAAVSTDLVPEASGEWAYPLAGGYQKGRGFGYHPVNGCSYCSTDHQGYDMAQGCGATIYAAGPGEVITASGYQGYGNAVRIRSAGGIVIIYGHMQWGSLRVAVGQHVTAGTPLGAEGNTGRSVGCHLHFEIRVNGHAVDPEPFMAALGLPLK